MSTQYKLYIITGCTMCYKAVQFLNSINIDISIVNLFEHPEKRAALQEKIGEVTVPVLVSDYDIFKKEEIFSINKHS
ncbi:glutaredoxin [Bacillus solimangrovi]|uniref:Glutaredoxin domain-containing protein n=1 Tax=Bacillus solimangrovi TaxID=1305675 RepID=A0A1E5LDX2_9BACI|nr:glutaredoxin [Bacillus solimangrovi]OEH92229.1 hypothetical protein BFG57_02880 [Bacillus solimangrovi]